jgi:dihydrodipicolinate synthase/N-acetylneuraminate lyase
VIFPSWGLNRLPEEKIADAFAQISAVAERFIAFELGEMFVPFGRIYSLATYRRLIEMPQCTGAKHSSLSRQLEWERLALRDELRADFTVLTGNDLAIDMVMYGSDYLLGLSTFAPDLFARRDALWQAADPRFYEVNDVLQYLGALAFRPPVSAYKHSAAQFLKLRGWIASDRTHPQSPERPASDVEILRPILLRLLELLR